MNKTLLIGGLVLITVAAIAFPNVLLNYKIHESKEFVIVKLLKLPNCDNGSYRNKFLTIEYQDSKYTLRTSCKYIKNLHIGEQIQMLHKKGTSNFVFENEDVIFELISNLLLVLGGIIIVVIALKKNKQL